MAKSAQFLFIIELFNSMKHFISTKLNGNFIWFFALRWWLKDFRLFVFFLLEGELQFSLDFFMACSILKL